MSSNKKITRHSLVYATVVCTLASMFYLYDFVLQVSPGVMTHELMSSFSIGAVGLGTISAFYYYAYTPMQLPAGILYDRFGPRVLIPIATAICAVGALFFASTQSVVFLSYGRFLMGFGSAFAFIGTLVLISRWFPTRYFAPLAGIAQLMSSVGAIFGEAPLAKAIETFGWRQSIMSIGIFGLFLAVIIWLIVRDYPPGTEPTEKDKKKKKSLRGLSFVLKSQQTWFVAIYAFAVWAPITVLGALWGVPFVKAYYNTSTAVASGAITMIWLAIGIASPVIGWVSEMTQRRCLPLSIVAIVGIVSALVMLYVPNLPFSVMYILMFGIGVAAAGQSLSFALIKDVTKPKYVGTAVGFNNMAVVAGGAMFQPFVGYLLHLFWNGLTINNVRIYDLAEFRHALWIIPICYLLAWILSAFLIKETHCHPAYLPEHLKKKETYSIDNKLQLSEPILLDE